MCASDRRVVLVVGHRRTGRGLAQTGHNAEEDFDNISACNRGHVRSVTTLILLLPTGRPRRERAPGPFGNEAFAAGWGGLHVPDLIDLVSDPVTHP